MSRLLQNIRLLYLLALFQLVGGPLVLGVVILFGKLTVQQVPERGVIASVMHTLQSERWSAITHDLLQDALPAPQPTKDKQPAPSKEMKGKLFAAGLEAPASAPDVVAQDRMPWAPEDVFATMRPQAPPGPPPRAA